MGQLAVAIVGGLVGSFFGMPQLGFLVGSLLGSFLFQPKGPSVGKVNDVKVTSSSYGEPIQEGFGYCRVGGNVIQASDLKEHKHSVGKGGGGAKQYTYTWTGAVAIAKGPIADVTRIWADSKLVFDKTGSVSPKMLNQYKLKFRLYTGTEDQLPDAALEAMVGADNAVPYRGLAYIVFDDIPVADYGNRVPNWTFEVAFNETNAVTTTAHKMADSNVITGIDGTNCLVDWNSNRGWFFSSGTGSSNGIRTNALSNGNVIDYASVSDIGLGTDGLTSQAATRDVNGYIYVTANGAGNQEPIFKIDGDGLVVVGQFGPAGTSFPGFYSDGFTPQGMFVPIVAGERNFLFCISRGSILGTDVGVFCTDSMSVRDVAVNSGLFTASGHGGSACHSCIGPSGVTSSVFVSFAPNFGSGTTNPIVIARYDVDDEGQIIGNTVVATLAPSDINPTWTHFIGHDGLTYDATDGTIICGFSTNDSMTSGNSQNYVCKIDGNGTILWAVPTNAICRTSQSMPQAVLVSGVYSFIGSNGESYVGAGDNVASDHALVYDIVTVDGTVSTESWPANISATGAQVWDSNAGAVLFYGQMSGVTSGSNKWIVIYTNRAQANAVGLDFVVSTICKQVGLTDSDIDVTDLAGIDVDGYVITSQQTAKDSIAPLALNYLFDGVEVDDKIKFVRRGHASVVTIPQADLAIIDTTTNSTSQETRTQEVDLPAQISVQFLDPNHDYQQATMYYRRPTSPAQTMRSSNQQSVSLPIVMQPLAAKQLAEQILFTSWVERVGYKVNLPWSYAKYDPSDNAVLTLSDGATIPIRFTEMNIGADLTIEMSSVAESGATYTPGVTSADGGSGFIPQTISAPTTNRLFLIDMPLPRDTDDPGNSTAILYYAAGAYDENWPGMEFYKSTDNAAFVDMGGVVVGSTWGVCLNTLADTDTPFGIDTKNSLTISVMQGNDNFASASLIDVCNGANAGLILNTSTGVVEIIQFTTVVDNGDGTFVLSGLIRGRRGTEVYTGSHSAGEVFILLANSDAATDTGVGGTTLGLGEVGVTRYYKGVADGYSLDLTPSQAFKSTGRTLKPYAPVSQAATLAGSDINISWERRTRIGGEWKDYTGTVPLSEDSESYEIDIYNGADVVRTLSATTTTVTYGSADITTDFGSTPDTLTIAVYQISGEVGRGFGKKVTVEVN